MELSHYWRGGGRLFITSYICSRIFRSVFFPLPPSVLLHSYYMYIVIIIAAFLFCSIIAWIRCSVVSFPRCPLLLFIPTIPSACSSETRRIFPVAFIPQADAPSNHVYLNLKRHVPGSSKCCFRSACAHNIVFQYSTEAASVAFSALVHTTSIAAHPKRHVPETASFPIAFIPLS